MSIKRFEEKFESERMTFTPQRKLIADILLNSSDHPDIDEIYMRAKEIDKTTSIATVYRTVNLFVTLGLIKKRDFKDDKSRYEFKLDNDHNHIIISDGRIIEFKNEKLQKIIEEIANHYDLEVEDYIVELYCKPK